MNITNIGRKTAVALAALTVLIGAGTIAHADSVTLGLGTQIIIDGNGDVAVRGATVTATTTQGLSASTGLGSTTLLWNVAANSATNFGARTKTLANVAIGDIVSFMGKITSFNGTTLNIDGNVVKDTSTRHLAQAKATLKGTVTSASQTGLVVKTGNTSTTVALSGTATIKLNGHTAVLGDIKVGDAVTAKGTLNATTNVFTANGLDAHETAAVNATTTLKADFDGFFKGFLNGFLHLGKKSD